ncbi:hypothetical protein MHYP_G00293680 [Metynnis hypsauchen]
MKRKQDCLGSLCVFGQVVSIPAPFVRRHLSTGGHQLQLAGGAPGSADGEAASGLLLCVCINIGVDLRRG